ncbi:MAG: 1,4-dihydroxy-6-naphthoate synthase [Bacteroidales bacterium]|nr:1,4-dihydroxy-6-naphthoate synthase [Bacteroidales bacterium]
MKLKLGFSPCPNDTYVFDAMVNGRIDTEGLEFDWFLADVEELNRQAFSSDADILKVSTHAYSYAASRYIILDSGSALGYGNGPLLVGKESTLPAGRDRLRVAIPGKYTTANLLFAIAFPGITDKPEYLFSRIEDAVLNGEVDAGLLIHETRFTYRGKGLNEISDLGTFWENTTGLPVPLGTIVISRSIPNEIALRVNRVLRRSVEFANENPNASSGFVLSNAQETDRSVLERHIRLYVNDFTVNLGDEGREAVTTLFRIASEKGAIPSVPEDIFLTINKSI